MVQWLTSKKRVIIANYVQTTRILSWIVKARLVSIVSLHFLCVGMPWARAK